MESDVGKKGTMSLGLAMSGDIRELEGSTRQDLAAALAQERTLLRTMIDLIPAFIYAKDVNSRFIAMNAALARNIGTNSTDAIGKTDSDFFAPELANKFFSDEQALIKSKQSIIGLEEPGFDKATGQPLTVVTSKVPLLDENGDVLGIIGIGFDVTERKRAEKRQADGEKLESIGRLAAGVAHEINTPIQYLNDSVCFIRDAMQELLAHNTLLTAMLPSPPVPDEDFEELKVELPPALDRVLDGLARIAEIVRSMKEFSHADQEQMSSVDLNRSIASTLVIARSEYKYVAEVETEFAEDLPPVSCHRGQINQVVLNLVVNAAHAIEDAMRGTGRKGITRVRTSVRNGEAVISVGDTGCGIPETIRARIFDPFFTTKEVGKGTGQGLSIAHNVVKSHGGALEFETEIGKGTTFYVRLPLAAAPASDEVPPHT